MNTLLSASIAALVGALNGLALEQWIQGLPPEEYPRERAIPARGVTVPIVGALLLGWIGWTFAAQPLWAALLCLYTLFYLGIFVTDFETRWIFSNMSYGAVAIAILASPLHPLGWRLALLGGALGLGFFGIAWLFARRFFGPGSFGRGDVTLGAFMGLTSSFTGVIIAIIAGVLANGVAALLMLLILRNKRAYMPYGPFLCVGGWIGMIWGDQLLRLWLGIP